MPTTSKPKGQADDFETRAKILIEALPYIHEFKDTILVLKLGGSALENLNHFTLFAKDVALLKAVGLQPIIVHGGGGAISRRLQEKGIKPTFFKGLRVTSADVLDAVAEVLLEINLSFVNKIHEIGGLARSVHSSDSGNFQNLFTARRKLPTSDESPPSSESQSQLTGWGLVGDICHVDRVRLKHLAEADAIPVISPIAPLELPQNLSGRWAADAQRLGETLLNVNADDAASAIAMAIPADKLIYMTDVPGILDANKELLPTVQVKQGTELVNMEIISGGMIPKFMSAKVAIQNGVKAVHILCSDTPHSVILELFTHGGSGTMITK